MENNELYHSGIKGMKWGIRRYQNEDGSLTEEGRRHYGYKLKGPGDLVKAIKTKHQAKVELKKKEKQRKERAKRLEAARKARAEKKAYNDAKKKALESGTADEVAKYLKDLTTDEKNKVANRLNADANLMRLADDAAARKAKEAAEKSKWNKFTRLTTKAGQLAVSIENTTKLYNSAAKIYNAFSEDKLPVVGENNKPQQDYFKESKHMANNLLKKSGDMSVEQMNEELERIGTINQIEKYAAGQGGGGGKKKKDKDKDKDKK